MNCHINSVSDVSSNQIVSYSSDGRPKSEGGRLPKLGLAADAAASGKDPSLTRFLKLTFLGSRFIKLCRVFNI